MNERMIKIYQALYAKDNCTKEKLMEYLGVSSIKTVENNIKSLDEITYDLKLRKYRFIELLPTYIPNESFFNIFKNSIVNKLLRNDFFLLKEDISSLKTNTMIKTSELSSLAQKIIMFYNAINNNCILKVEYKKYNSDLGYKYIKPNTIFSNGFTYYAYITYAKENKVNIDETRTFAFNAIGKIEPIEYVGNENFQKEEKGNAFGSFKKDKYVILNLHKQSANFFKREMLFNNDAFELINEELGGESITVKMYYNNEFEIVKIIQQWMPEITIQNNIDLRNKVYSIISSNFSRLKDNK